jgi:phosphoglucomutase
MTYNNSKAYLEYQNLKKNLKKDLLLFIEKEFSSSISDIDKINFLSKKDKFFEKILLNLDNWMQSPIPEKYKEIVIKSISQNKWSNIIEAFKEELVFGTNGIRGKLVVALDEQECISDLKSLNEFGFESEILRGTNSINEITIIKNIFGLINYMEKKKLTTIVIGYDSRICSKIFSRLISNIFLEKKIYVILFDRINSLPELSFAVTHFKADMGIEITASHNDKRYNGYKLITKYGSALTNKIREEISYEIFNNNSDVSYDLLSYDYNDEKFIFVSNNILILNDFSASNSKNNVIKEYLNQISNVTFDKNIINKFASKISISYSALHGTGYLPVSKLFEKNNITNIKYITKMILPDPFFSAFNSKQILDPSDFVTSNVIANRFIEQYGNEEFKKLDLLCYTDPDADRLGVIIQVPKDEQIIYGQWKLLKANDVWALFLWYILENILKNTKSPFNNLKQLFIVKSFVTSDLLLYISKKYKIESIDGKVGFSDLSEIVRKKWKENKHNIGMFEESCGFGIPGNHENNSTKLHILEKDGILALSLIIEILCYAKSQNLSLQDLLNKIYCDNEIGFFATSRKELPEQDIFEGISEELNQENILRNVENLYFKANQKIKNNKSLIICGLPISKVEKFSTGRYDSKFWKNFPDEGIRFTLNAVTNHITIRSSGTEPKIRIFVQYRITDINKNNIVEKKLFAEQFVKKLSKEIENLIKISN